MPPVEHHSRTSTKVEVKGSPPVPRAPWAASWDASNEARFVEWRRAFTAHESAALGRRTTQPVSEAQYERAAPLRAFQETVALAARPT